VNAASTLPAAAPSDIMFQLATELGRALAVRKFASEQTDAAQKPRILKLNTPLHNHILRRMDDYQG
jgi:hypothetical protein